jgi:hypothetical protein
LCAKKNGIKGKPKCRSNRPKPTDSLDGLNFKQKYFQSKYILLKEKISLSFPWKKAKGDVHERRPSMDEKPYLPARINCFQANDHKRVSLESHFGRGR